MNNIPKVEFVLRSIKSYLDGGYQKDETYPFHLELEHELLFKNFDQMCAENQEVTLLLNDEIPDLCAAVGEIGVDEFKRLLEVEYEKVAKVYYGFNDTAKRTEIIT